MKTTQITRQGQKVTCYDFTEDERDRALDKLDTIENMLMAVLMGTECKS